jgi:hypothetical protein
MFLKRFPNEATSVVQVTDFGGDEEVAIRKTKASDFYVWANSLRNMFLTLHRQGYMLSQKYEGRIHDADFQENTLKEARKNYKKYFKEKEERNKENSKKDRLDKDGEFRFPTYTINGQEFTLYGKNRIYEYLRGKDFHLEGDHVNEILESFRKITEYDRLYSIVAQEFMTLGGEKGIIEYVYKEDMKDKIVTELLRVNELLNGQLPEFTEALAKNYKEFLKENNKTLIVPQKKQEEKKV